MYHYVRDNSDFKAMDLDSFRHQIKLLKSKYEIIGLHESRSYRGHKPSCVITFDDGLKDIITNVLPILQEEQVKATCFIPTVIFREHKILGVQKKHLLLAKLGTQKLVKELNNLLPPELLIRADKSMKGDYLDDLLTCSLKWMLDYIDTSIIDPILDAVFKKHLGEESDYFSSIYLSKSDVDNLIACGIEIGAHGYRHKPLGTLYYSDQEKEVRRVTEDMRLIIGDKPLYMSYPSGSYSPLTMRLLDKYGYTGAVTINKHENTNSTPKYELGRYDCIDVHNL